MKIPYFVQNLLLALLTYMRLAATHLTLTRISFYCIQMPYAKLLSLKLLRCFSRISNSVKLKVEWISEIFCTSAISWFGGFPPFCPSNLLLKGKLKDTKANYFTTLCVWISWIILYYLLNIPKKYFLRKKLQYGAAPSTRNWMHIRTSYRDWAIPVSCAMEKRIIKLLLSDKNFAKP